MLLPKALRARIISMMAMGTLVAVSTALATNYLPTGDGRLSHQHSGYQRAFNEVNQNGTVFDLTDLARSNWDVQTNAAVVRWGTHDDAQQHYVDDVFGMTGWQGAADVAFHPTHAHTYYNYSYFSSWNYTHAIACQEIGHLLGLGHFDGDCMGAGYYSWTTGVGSHSVNMVNTIVGNPQNHL